MAPSRPRPSASRYSSAIARASSRAGHGVHPASSWSSSDSRTSRAPVAGGPDAADQGQRPSHPGPVDPQVSGNLLGATGEEAMVIEAPEQIPGQVRVGRRGARPADLREQLLGAGDGRRPLGLGQPCAIRRSYRSWRKRRLWPSPGGTADRAVPRPAQRAEYSPVAVERRVRGELPFHEILELGDASASIPAKASSAGDTAVCIASVRDGSITCRSPASAVLRTALSPA